MITALLSSKEVSSEVLNSVISKKLDSVNNLQIALDKEGGIVVYPLDYPSSINAMIRAISMADRVLMVINEEITAVDAEIALAIENSRIDIGTTLRTEYSDEGSFSKFFEKYKVGKFKVLRPGEQQSDDSGKAKNPSFSYISIDKHFIVKGIGSVIIGFNLGCSIKKGDRLRLLPSMKEVSIKSIQIMDIDSPSAENGQHVGLALNNINEGDLSSNYAVSSLGELAENRSCKVIISSLYKGDLTQEKDLGCAMLGRNFSISITGSGTSTTITFNRPVAKIGGRHLIMDASLSVGKNRVVGSFEFS